MKERLKEKFTRVKTLLEIEYKMDMNTVEKITSGFFAEGYLPVWYLSCKSSEEISRHLFVLTQLLNANTEHLAEVSDDGKEITYFINVGRDFPGKLHALLVENRDIDFVSYDSIKLQSGVRIVSIVKKNFFHQPADEEDKEKRAALLESVRSRGAVLRYNHTESFIAGLSSEYLDEELSSTVDSSRILRHLGLYETLLEQDPFCFTEDVSHSREIRYTIGCRNCSRQFPLDILMILKKHSLNLSRSYFDLLQSNDPECKVGILSVYFEEHTDTAFFREELKRYEWNPAPSGEQTGGLEDKLEDIVRMISRDDLTEEQLFAAVGDLKELIRQNKDISRPVEIGNYLLNSLSDFFDALGFLELDSNPGVLKRLIGYDAFDEFWVETKQNGTIRNTEGFRTKHNSVRGTNKGGIRNDMIVEFSEVAALSFMMTWKCARSKILFGGGKGGLRINPREFGENKIDFFDTLSNFGRALFLVTGPAKDVPAGDVGCGAREIGHMFEGFKSALHDIALIANGVKKSSAFLGNKVVSLESARNILKNHFDIDYQDTLLLKELTSNEKYLELVAAPQITGKPRMGIQARTGATGRGLCYAILAAVANEYISGKWDAAESLSDKEQDLLSFFTSITEAAILEKNGIGILSEAQWNTLNETVFPKLLKGKTVLVQGSGKVGSSVIEELSRFQISLAGVADREGGIFGNPLNTEEVLHQAMTTGTVMGCRKGVTHTIPGASGGTEILEQECDILVLAALENTITIRNAEKIQASLIVCGSNGPNTSKAEVLLNKRSMTVIYDFLANGAGVTASYFEWLRNLTERFRYEAEVIKQEKFDMDRLDSYIMPEFRARIKEILRIPESGETTKKWNMILRDIMVAALNEDYKVAKTNGISMKTAGFVNAQLRVLTATLMKMSPEGRNALWNTLSDKSRDLLMPFMDHPEAELHNTEAAGIRNELYRCTTVV